MNPHRTTISTVGALLLAAVLCVGHRYRQDQETAKNPGLNRNKGDSTVGELPPGYLATRRERTHGPRDRETLEKQLRTVFDLANSNQRHRAILDFTSRLSPEEWPVTYSIVKGWDPLKWYEESALLMEAWCEQDAPAAVEWMAGSHSPDLTKAIGFWTRKDGPAAIAWLDQHRTGNPSWEGLMTESIGSLAGNLPLLLKALQSLPHDNLGYTVICSRLDLSKIPDDDLKSWLQGMDETTRREMLGATLLAIKEPEKLLKIFNEFPGELEPAQLSTVYQAWVKADSVEAFESLKAVTPGKDRDFMAKGMVYGFNQLGKTSEALDVVDFSPSIADISLLNDIVLSCTAKDAERLMSYMPLMKEDTFRIENSRMVLGAWAREDPEAAKQWVRTHDVAEVLKQEFDK